jgi:protease-4
MNRQQLLVGIFIFYIAAFLVGTWTLLPEGHWKHVPHHAGAKAGRLAVVQIYGVIQANQSASPWGNPGADDIVRRLHQLSEDDSVKAILLRINSPGGTVAAVQEIHTEILRCKSKGQKVVASLGDVAASGGYYLASAADRVVADPGTITGSIGVILEFGNLEGLMQKLGVKLQVIKSGEHKDIGSPARALTAEERQLLQASIDDAYDQFVKAVAQGRHLSEEKVKPLADGRIFTGKQAVDAGLVDELGNREDAIQKAIALAHLPEHPMIVTDSNHSFVSLMKHLSSREGTGAFETLSDHWNGPALEYRWK